MVESLKNQIKEHLLKEGKAFFKHEPLNCDICNPTFTIELSEKELKAVMEFTTNEDWQSGIPDGKTYDIDLNNYYLFRGQGLIEKKQEIEEYDTAKGEAEAEIQEEDIENAKAEEQAEIEESEV